MKIEEFASALAEKLEEKFEGRYIIQTGERKKWNQTVYKTLQFVKIDNKKVSPCIYVDPYYRSFIDDDATIEEIVGFIKSEFEQECLPKAEKLEALDVNEVMSWDKVRDNIFLRLINKNFNEDEYLPKVPHKEFLNLSCIYHILVEETEKYSLTVIVNNNHMKLWGLSSVELIHKVAIENARKNTPAVLIPMASIIAELIIGEPDEKLEEELLKESREPHMYVFTNKKRKYGAATLVYDIEQLREFANKENSDLLILPSSIHEVIIVPMLEDTADEIEKYLQIVKDVNREDMDPEEILADNVYIYRRDDEKIEIAM